MAVFIAGELATIVGLGEFTASGDKTGLSFEF
jgi:hypothetical protein